MRFHFFFGFIPFFHVDDTHQIKLFKYIYVNFYDNYSKIEKTTIFLDKIRNSDFFSPACLHRNLQFSTFFFECFLMKIGCGKTFSQWLIKWLNKRLQILSSNSTRQREWKPNLRKTMKNSLISLSSDRKFEKIFGCISLEIK